MEACKQIYHADPARSPSENGQESSFSEQSVLSKHWQHISPVPGPRGRREMAWYRLLAHARPFPLYFRKIVMFT